MGRMGDGGLRDRSLSRSLIVAQHGHGLGLLPRLLSATSQGWC